MFPLNDISTSGAGKGFNQRITNKAMVTLKDQLDLQYKLVHVALVT